MIKEFKLPDLGEGIDSAVVSEISIKNGDIVTKNDTLFVLESDKASMEIPSDYSGKITDILVQAGQEVSTGCVLVKIQIDEDFSRIEKKAEKTIEKEVLKEIEVKTTKQTQTLKPLEKFKNSVFASPGVRRLARELEIDLRNIQGSGVKGRITKDDLHGHIRLRMQTPTQHHSGLRKTVDFSKWGVVDIEKLTRVNKITGDRLQQAWQDVPHVTQYDTSDITKLESYRKKLKDKEKKSGIKVTFLPFLMKAVVLVLKEIPRFNSSLDVNGENLIIKKYYNIGIAVDTPSGLVVPSIKNVDKKSIVDISKELMDVSDRARNKKLKPEEFQGSTFTISSLGGIGGTSFSPIVNPPEVAILGVSKSSWKPRFDQENNEFKPYYELPFSLSYDHRVIDGASGAVFTKTLSQKLSDPKIFKE